MKKILVSPGYGAGWSTWSGSEFSDFLLSDPTLIEMAERGADVKEVDAYVKSKYPDGGIYTGGWDDIEVVHVSEGSSYRIREYDGYESVEFRDNVDWKTA